MLKKIKDFIAKVWKWTGTGYIEVIETSPPSAGVLETLENPVASSAITRIAQSASSVPLLIYKGEELVSEGDPAATFAERFNEDMTTPTATYLITTDLLLFGNSFWHIRRLGRRILALDYIPHDSISQDLERKRYILHAAEGSKTLSKEDIVHFKLINPADPTGFGLSKVFSIQGAVTLMREIDKLCVEYFHNGAIPLGVVINKSMLTEEQKQHLLEKLQARIGRGRRYSWLVLSGDMDLKVVDAQVSNASILELKKLLREEVLSALNVPPAIVGIYEYANYANAREQTKIFWRETVLPLLNLIQETLNLQFFSRHFGSQYWCVYDTTQVDALQETLGDLSDSVVRLVQSGVITINEARERLGYDEPLPWGDTWWGSISTVPVATQKEGTESKGFIVKRLSQKELIFWRRFLRYQDRYERFLKDAVKDYAEGLKRRLKARLAKMKDLAGELHNVDEEAKLLWEVLQPILEEALRNAPSYFEVEIADTVLFDAKVRANLMKFQNRIKWVTEATYQELKQALAEVMESGGGWGAMLDAVEGVVGELETYRAERIARTESSGALNAGYLDSLMLAGFRKKMWLAALDERTRPTHAEANGQVVEVSEPFLVGGYQLKYPADPTGAPEETINCRCTVIPVEE